MADNNLGSPITGVPKHLAKQANVLAGDPWWAVAAKDRADTVRATVKRWQHQHKGRLKEYELLLSEYVNAPVGLEPGTYEAHGRRDAYLRYNLFRSIIGTLVARYAKERPRPVFSTERGKYRQRRHAKDLNKAVLGIFEQNKVYMQGPNVFRDVCTFGMGALKACMHPTTLDITYERVLPNELYWDVIDAHRGMPHELAHVVATPRYMLVSQYPKYKEGIMEADPVKGTGYSVTTSDLVEVYEVWKLASYPGAGDGRHTISCGNVTLVDEVWSWDFYPLAFMHYEESFRGFSGEGLGALLAGMQFSVNSDLESMEEKVRRGSKHRAFVPAGGGIKRVHLENEEDTPIYEYDGDRTPTFETPVVLQGDEVEFSRWKISAAQEISGASQLSISGQKPGGVEAAVAFRELQDIESLRFMLQQHGYDQLFIDLANITVHMMHKWWSGKGKTTITRGKGFIEKINFDAIDLERDDYDITVQAASMLPKTLGAKMATVREMFDLGWVSQERALALMEITDLDAETSLKTAAVDDIDATIDSFLFDEPTKEEMELQADAIEAASALPVDEKDAEMERIKAELLFIPPQPEQALQEGIERMKAALLREKYNDVPEARLDLLRRWITEATEELAKLQPAGMPGGNAIGVTPEAMGLGPAGGTPTPGAV